MGDLKAKWEARPENAGEEVLAWLRGLKLAE